MREFIQCSKHLKNVFIPAKSWIVLKSVFITLLSHQCKRQHNWHSNCNLLQIIFFLNRAHYMITMIHNINQYWRCVQLGWRIKDGKIFPRPHASMSVVTKQKRGLHLDNTFVASENITAMLLLYYTINININITQFVFVYPPFTSRGSVAAQTRQPERHPAEKQTKIHVKA